MRALAISFALILVAATALAGQQPAAMAPAPTVTFSSAADVTALMAKVKSERKAGQAMVGGTILNLAPYNAHLEYRASIGTAAVHETEAELMYVIDGSATLVTGGKLVSETRTNPTNLSGTAIEGGTSKVVGKGDFFIVPEGTPHWFSKIDGAITLMTLHLKRPVQ